MLFPLFLRFRQFPNLLCFISFTSFFFPIKLWTVLRNFLFFFDASIFLSFFFFFFLAFFNLRTFKRRVHFFCNLIFSFSSLPVSYFLFFFFSSVEVLFENVICIFISFSSVISFSLPLWCFFCDFAAFLWRVNVKMRQLVVHGPVCKQAPPPLSFSFFSFLSRAEKFAHTQA